MDTGSEVRQLGRTTVMLFTAVESKFEPKLS